MDSKSSIDPLPTEGGGNDMKPEENGNCCCEMNGEKSEASAAHFIVASRLHFSRIESRSTFNGQGLWDLSDIGVMTENHGEDKSGDACR